jgi:hypothetical protein
MCFSWSAFLQNSWLKFSSSLHRSALLYRKEALGAEARTALSGENFEIVDLIARRVPRLVLHLL